MSTIRARMPVFPSSLHNQTPPMRTEDTNSKALLTVRMSDQGTANPESGTPRPTTRYTPKRPHKKSRAGCVLCKQRKIKCDEQHPQCTPCKKRKIRCSFTGTNSTGQNLVLHTSNPSIGLHPPCGLNPTDFRLMHHFATATAESLGQSRPGMEIILRKEIPRLAFQHDYLMHCILSLSSLHIESMAPLNPIHNHKAVVLHHVNAISGFRKAISNLSAANSEAVLITSLFLVVVGTIESASNGDGKAWINSWLGLHMGMRSLIDQLTWGNIQSLPIAPVFNRGAQPALIPVNLPVRLCTMMSYWDMNNPNCEILYRALLSLGALYSMLQDSGPTSNELFLKTSSWPASLPLGFAALVRQMRPEALGILAYFLAFYKMVFKPFWYSKGISERGIDAIESVIDDKWKFLLQIPRKSINLDDAGEMRDLLLSEIPKQEEDSDLVYSIPSVVPKSNIPLQRRPALYASDEAFDAENHS